MGWTNPGRTVDERLRVPVGTYRASKPTGWEPYPRPLRAVARPDNRGAIPPHLPAPFAVLHWPMQAPDRGGESCDGLHKQRTISQYVGLRAVRCRCGVGRAIPEEQSSDAAPGSRSATGRGAEEPTARGAHERTAGLLVVKPHLEQPRNVCPTFAVQRFVAYKECCTLRPILFSEV